MAEDLEVGVMLEVDESQLEQVEDKQVDVGGGGGGDLSPAQRDQQEGVVAGGVSKGLAGAAVLAGILSQLKAVTAPIKAIFGIISRALVPVAELIADLIRPLASGINEFISDPVDAVGGPQAERNLESTFDLGGTTAVGAANPLLQISSGAQSLAEEFSGQNNNQENILSQFITDTAKSADQTGEANKIQLKNFLENPVKNKLGGKES